MMSNLPIETPDESVSGPSGNDSSTFDYYYYAHSCGVPYQRNEGWLSFYEAIAERIVSDIHPSSVLEAGCAFGFLVEKLRQQGVEAWGFDISEYAIQNVHPSMQAYCWVGSITDPLPRRYDLIITMEVIEHLTKPDGERAVANLCRFSDDILFSSTPLDYQTVTHVNVQPPEYWAQQFGRQGFFHDVDFDASFITPWAARFRRRNEPTHRLVADYERRFWQLWKENVDLRRQLANTNSQLKADEQAIQSYRNQLEAYEKQDRELQKSLAWKVLLALRLGRARLSRLWGKNTS
jgi:cyclopropane fatty-acyl-phospholipid synthase-like methyltransferase